MQLQHLTFFGAVHPLSGVSKHIKALSQSLSIKGVANINTAALQELSRTFHTAWVFHFPLQLAYYLTYVLFSLTIVTSKLSFDLGRSEYKENRDWPFDKASTMAEACKMQPLTQKPNSQGVTGCIRPRGFYRAQMCSCADAMAVTPSANSGQGVLFTADRIRG